MQVWWVKTVALTLIPKLASAKTLLQRTGSVFGSKSSIQAKNKSLDYIMLTKYTMEQAYQFKFAKACVEAVAESYCRWAFPKCDQTSRQPLLRPICRETCEYTHKTCIKQSK